MSDRLVICARCDAIVQPGTGMPIPVLCDGCKENAEKDAAEESQTPEPPNPE